MIYNINFLKQNYPYLLNGFPLDLTMTNNPQFTKLTPTKLLIMQDVEKYSETALTDTSSYLELYKKTRKFLNAQLKPYKIPHFLKNK